MMGNVIPEETKDKAPELILQGVPQSLSVIRGVLKGNEEYGNLQEKYQMSDEQLDVAKRLLRYEEGRLWNPEWRTSTRTLLYYMEITQEGRDLIKMLEQGHEIENKHSYRIDNMEGSCIHESVLSSMRLAEFMLESDVEEGSKLSIYHNSNFREDGLNMDDVTSGFDSLRRLASNEKDYRVTSDRTSGADRYDLRSLESDVRQFLDQFEDPDISMEDYARGLSWKQAEDLFKEMDVSLVSGLNQGRFPDSFYIQTESGNSNEPWGPSY